MSMVTSCPACTTTFRITPEQLKQREGKVRCGKCSDVFDAFKTLASLPDDVPSTDADSGESAPSARADEGKHVRRDDARSPQIQGTLDILPPAVAASASAQPQAGFGALRSRRTAWIVGIVVLAIALTLQLGYALRDQIAAAWPASRPALERACATLGCTVDLPRRTEQLAIESSDLQADPKRANVIVLTATVRNRGGSIVAHPSLELTLTDAQDRAVARRIFQPADYLSDPTAATRGMEAMTDVNVRISLDTGDLKPAGYRLFLFYP